MTVLVTGASGKVGRHVVQALDSRGVPARPATRRSSIPLDWTDPAGWNAALAGVDRVFLVMPGGDDGHRSVTGLGRRVIRFLDLAEQSGVGRVVLMTAMGMQYVPSEVDQRAVELRVQSSSMRWTILRPNWFYQNVTEGPLRDLAEAYAGRLLLPTGDAAVSFIDARDIAAVAVAALVADHHGHEYTLTGSESLTFADVASLASAEGLPVTAYEHVPVAQFRHAVLDLGWEPSYVDTMCQLFATIAAGHAAHISQDVPSVLGRNPTTFTEFAQQWQASIA
ncbi:NAD(P)H-binding protein [Phytoactinopolyspora mesophila]|uniref:NAD(P)H-binding protein n=1 Tax=Phytoactinopolyspora mesophila TaxID=2650750 RepID=A0A7K3M4S4_9ACTN|nr:NAD(P)H-binding protein [Phytoactinopolyspora mesophila]NDL58304.1 NAD(P)H-binding protein [Phytoactinopolyspora mesophila]